MIPSWGAPVPLPVAPPLPPEVDVLVVGGGIAGLSLLRELRGRGVDAHLVERGIHGCGASGRNAGFLLAGVSDSYAAAVTAHGREVAREVWEFTAENHARLRALDGIAGAGYRRQGSWTVAVDDAEAAELRQAHELMREDGIAATLLDPPPHWATAVLVNDADGEVHPRLLLDLVAAPLASRIHESTDVVGLDDAAGGVTVHLAGGTMRAGAVVVATNAWLPQLVPAAPVRPVRAQMLAAAGPAWQDGSSVPVYAERGHVYWRQLADGTVLAGGFRHRAVDDEVGYDVTPTDAVQRHLDGLLADIQPRGTVTHRWAGTMGFSADGLPLVGRLPGAENVHVCGGFTGHGMGFAVQAAHVLVAHLLDGAALPGWLAASR